MRLLIATDSFKGSLDAPAACAAIARGARAIDARIEIDVCPLADGGEGTAAVLQSILGGRWIERDVSGPMPAQRVRAQYLWIPGARPTAVIDLAAASGLTLVPRERLDPLRASTYGTGELLRDAIDRGAHRVWLALGGSATVDGGVGMATALGWRFLDASGRSIGPGGGELERIARIVAPPDDASARVTALRDVDNVRVTALRDVDNPLLGERGAARVFGPQKGATPPVVERLERGLDHLAAAIERDLGIAVRSRRGGGSAGGAAAGAVAFLGGRLVAGARLVLRLARFDARLRAADYVITGEGRLDSQSLDGKVVSAVVRAAARHAVPVAAVAGRVALDATLAAASGLLEIEAAAPPEVSDADALALAEPLLEAASSRLTTRLVKSRRRET
jgi:glycerate kinase